MAPANLLDIGPWRADPHPGRRRGGDADRPGTLPGGAGDAARDDTGQRGDRDRLRARGSRSACTSAGRRQRGRRGRSIWRPIWPRCGTPLRAAAEFRNARRALHRREALRLAEALGARADPPSAAVPPALDRDAIEQLATRRARGRQRSSSTTMSELDSLIATPRSSCAAARAASARRRRPRRSGLQAARRGRRCVVVTIDPAEAPRRRARRARWADQRPDSAHGRRSGVARRAVGADARHGDDVRRLVVANAAERRAGRADPDQLVLPQHRRLAQWHAGVHGGRASATRCTATIASTSSSSTPRRRATRSTSSTRRGTLARFLDHPVFKLMMLPTRRGLRVLNIAAQPMLRSIGKVVGSDVLADAVAFFQAFAGMETGFRDRADEVIELLLTARPRASCWSPRRGSTPSTRRASSPAGWSRRTSASPRSSSTGDTRLRRTDRRSGLRSCVGRRAVRQPGRAARAVRSASTSTSPR